MLEPQQSNINQAKDGANFPEMERQIAGLRQFLKENTERTTTVSPCMTPGELTERFHFCHRGQGTPEMILAGNLAAELGHPRTVSRSILLTTTREGIVRPQTVHRIGPDIDALPERPYHPFVQIVLLQLRPEMSVQPYELEQTLYLVHRLPGVMVRSVPGRVWLRFSREGQQNGMNLSIFGSALNAAFTLDFPAVAACESVFVTSGEDDVNTLAVLATEAEILQGRHRKLSLGKDGEATCQESNCDICDEKPVCDNLRNIRIKRRRFSS